VTAVIQTLWCELLAATLVDAGVTTCVVSPGSRSTPLVLALAALAELDLPTLIDERAAAFYALGVARATGRPAALLCTSGSAAAHYLPALVEASLAGVPLLAITADRPPELHRAGASQTIDQTRLYGAFVRASVDLGAPVGSGLALRALRRAVIQAVTTARGPHPGPVHLNVPLRKPLEPARPATAEDHALAALAASTRGPVRLAAPTLTAPAEPLAALAAAIAAEPAGLIVAGADPALAAARPALLALAARAGYPLLAEAGSQLRFVSRGAPGAPPGVAAIDHFDLILASPSLAGATAPRLILQLGAEPVSPGWVAAQPALAGAARYVLASHTWQDPASSAHAVLVGDVAASAAALLAHLPSTPPGRAPGRTPFAAGWLAAEARAAAAIEAALADHPDGEGAAIAAAVAAAGDGALLQLGNSLPIRVIDLVCAGGQPRDVLTQRGAAGIDGLIASAAGATSTGRPVLLILGDVSFAHDLGGLLAARLARAPLAIVVIDNGGGQIFGTLPVAAAAAPDALARHFTTAPALDPVAVAAALGLRAALARDPAAVRAAVTAALAAAGPTVIHAPVAPTGARDLRRAALASLSASTPPAAPVSIDQRATP
jgi:2-succinyl-5-enolpyruvyl-6-hydroxy-3-cyclohexene-1-carboxylate synthase